MLQSVLHKIRPLLALFDLGQARHMGDPQAMRKDRARARGILQPPRSQFKRSPFLLNKEWDYYCCGEITLKEGKEEKLKMPLS